MLKLRKNFSRFLFLFSLPLIGFASNRDNRNRPPYYSLNPSDELQFGRLWRQIKRLEEDDQLKQMIEMRRNEIAIIKDHWKEKIPLFEDSLFIQEVEDLLINGKLLATELGCGAAYFLLDEKGNEQFVIKPFDEDILCLNNRKKFASPFRNRAFRVRESIPVYRSAQVEVLAYRVAKMLDLQYLTPETHLAIITHQTFFDISKRQDSQSDPCYLGPPVFEKLCSVQRFLPNLDNLYNLVDNWLAENMEEDQILKLINQDEFEDLLLLIWILYDTDAHAGNLYTKEKNDNLIHLCKIDNGLTFPEKNSHLLNSLYFFPHAKLPVSERLCQKINDLPIEAIADEIHFFELDEALDAFYERMELLQTITKEPCSLREIDMRLRALGLPNGQKIAYSDLTLLDLQKLISYE